MKPLFIVGLTCALLAPGKPALACMFDTDCEVGSRCLKSSGSIYGICAGGLAPGNRHDRTPVYAPLDINRSYGNTRSFDLDCGIGGRCLKSSGRAFLEKRSGVYPRRADGPLNPA
jgi:hypothetical protein